MSNPIDSISHSLFVVRLKDLWNKWDIRIFILASLSIQILLTLLAPLRKRSASSLLMSMLWILYLSADAIALYTIGLVSSTDGPAEVGTPDVDLLAFWAPFLLLHLGGPDTITALALEDNELWRRHALQLVGQIAVTVYVFLLSFDKMISSGLLGPTLLMFVDGCIKYCERTFALYYASLENFRLSQRTKPEPGPNYARLMEEYSSAASGSIPVKIQGKNDPSDGNRASKEGDGLHGGLDKSKADSEDQAADGCSHWYRVAEDDEMVKEAYTFYDKFQGLLADSFLSLKERDASRATFLLKSAPKAFRIIEIELNFIYDVFYTKAFLLQKRPLGYIRLSGPITALASLTWFSIKEKSNHNDIDIRISFALLAGAIVLDWIGTIMFLLSDWSIVVPSWGAKRKVLSSVVDLMHLCSKWAADQCRKLTRSRWSRSIKTYTLLEQCLKDPPAFCPKWMEDFVKNLLTELLYVRTKKAGKQLGDFIFEELKTKAQATGNPQSVKEVCEARGNLVLQEDYLLVSEYLRPWTIDVDYDESLLIWHLATDLCYWSNADIADPPQKRAKTDDGDLLIAGTDDHDHDQLIASTHDNDQPTASTHGDDQQTRSTNDHEQHTANTNDGTNQAKNDGNQPKNDANQPKQNYREVSKDISDYMSYLFLRQQALVSPVVGTSEVRFQDTSAEAKKFMHDRLHSWFADIGEMILNFLEKVLQFLAMVMNFLLLKILCCPPWMRIPVEVLQDKGKERERVRERILKRCSRKVLSVRADVRPIVAKGDKSKSVLFDACRLAKQLQKFDDKQWEITAKVWVELLCYAAVRCTPRAHVAELNKGGELITLVWLLMAHLGLGDQFRQDQGFGWTKLIIPK